MQEVNSRVKNNFWTVQFKIHCPKSAKWEVLLYRCKENI